MSCSLMLQKNFWISPSLEQNTPFCTLCYIQWCQILYVIHCSNNKFSFLSSSRLVPSAPVIWLLLVLKEFSWVWLCPSQSLRLELKLGGSSRGASHKWLISQAPGSALPLLQRVFVGAWQSDMCCSEKLAFPWKNRADRRKTFQRRIMNYRVDPV